jgi:hypothetical protein
MTITEFGAGKGCIRSRVRSIKVWKLAVSKAPSIMSQCSTPSLSDRAGRTENLIQNENQSHSQP